MGDQFWGRPDHRLGHPRMAPPQVALSNGLIQGERGVDPRPRWDRIHAVRGVSVIVRRLAQTSAAVLAVGAIFASSQLPAMAQVISPAKTSSSATITGVARVGSRVTCNVTPKTTQVHWWLSGNPNVIVSNGPSWELPTTASGSSLIGKRIVCGFSVILNTNERVGANSRSVVVQPGVFRAPSPTAAGVSATHVTKVGVKLTALPGVWTPSASSFTYVWKRGATTVGNKRTYTTSSADVGKALVLVVTGHRSGFTTKASSSAKISVKNLFTTTGTPNICVVGGACATAKDQVLTSPGHKLQAKPGSWSPSGATFTYTWIMRDAAHPTGLKVGTGPTFTPKAGQTGFITVTVAADKTNFLRATATSWKVGIY